MLYTYHVDIGRMLAFDMDLAMKRVRDLKKEIEKTCNIPYVNLVLFVSGGQIMDGKRVVGSYQAGTDNNPIWLVDNRTYNQNQTPKAYIPPSPDDRLQGFVENSMKLPPTYETIVTRAQLAMSFHEISREELKICETLVKDQHFQHQGWAALKCTLEDKGIALDKNKNRFLKIYNQFLAERREALFHLEQYEKTNALIHKIPIPKCLDHYAKKCADRLMRESIAATTNLERKISNFVSCVDKLERSEFTSSSSSGPPSGKFTEGGGGYLEEPSSSTDPSKIQSRMTVPELPPLEEVEGNGASTTHTASSPVQIRKSTGVTQASKSHRSSETDRLKREGSLPSGFTSPGAQSPLSNPGTPKRLSYTDDNVDTTKRLQLQGPSSTTGSQEKAIRFEISPSNSLTSQGSLPGSRSNSPAPGTRRMLSDWIRGNDSRDPIESVKRELREKFERLTPKLSEEIVNKCEEVQRSLDNKSMKEFKGLDRRLAGLEQLMIQMREIVSHQSDMAQGFIQNQQRAKSERDPSILPDLCSSHKKQLEVMLENHQRVCDILRRVRNAKQELCTVMHARIRWIMHMEERLREVDNEVVMTQGMVSRMFSYMKTIKQVHETPALFAEAIIEGFRRRRFAVRFMEWAGGWAEENSSLYRKELERRNEFNQHLSGHFLLRMFTGYGESPPEFATKAPDPFDTELPNITVEDIDNLKRDVPEIAHLLVIPDDTELGKRISTNTLRAISSTSLLPLIGGGASPVTKVTMTTDQATSYSMTGSDFHLTSAFTDDIVVLNANGEQGLLSPSPEHKPTGEVVLSSQRQGSELVVKEGEGSGTVGEGQPHEVDLMQSVEVISEEDGLVLSEGLKQDTGTTPFTAYRRKADDMKSLSVQEPRSFEDVEGELAFHSVRSLSLDEAHFTGKSLKSPLSGTSPDLDDYATADFYIDESIPSALSMSSPDKIIADLHLQLEEKSSALVQKETEVKQLQEDNGSYKEKHELLQNTFSVLRTAIHSIVDSHSLPDLKGELENLKRQTRKDVDHVKCDITQLSQHVTLLVQRLNAVNASLQKECDVLVKGAKEEARQAKVMLEECTNVIEEEWQQKLKSAQDQLEQEKLRCEKTVSDLREEMKVREGEVSALVKERDKLKEEVVEVEQEKVELDSRLGVERELLQTGENRLTGVEEELKKVKDSLKSLTEHKETLTLDLLHAKQLHDQQVEQLQEEFSKQLESQTERLEAAQRDAESYRKLLDDKTVLLEAKSEQLQRQESEHQKSIEKYVDESEEKYKSALETYESELQTTRCELTLEHEVEMEKVKSDLLLEVADKEQALDLLQEKLDHVSQQLEQLRQDKETELQHTHQQFQTEKEEMLKILGKDQKESLDKREEELKETFRREEQERREAALKEQEKELQSVLGEEAEKRLLSAVKDKENEVRSLLEDEYLLNLKEGLEKQEVELRRMCGEEEGVRLLAALEEKERELIGVYEGKKNKAVEERELEVKQEQEQRIKEVVEEAQRKLREMLEGEKVKALEERELEVKQQLEQEQEQMTKEVVEEAERKLREILEGEKNKALEERELEVKQQLEQEQEQRTKEAIEEAEMKLREMLAEEENHRLKVALEQREKDIRSALEVIEKERLAEALETQERDLRQELEEEGKKRLEEALRKCEVSVKVKLEEEGQGHVEAVVRDKQLEFEEKLRAMETQNQDNIEAIKREHDKELEEQYLQSDAKLEELRSQLTGELRERTQKEQLQLAGSQREILAALETEKEKEMSEMKESLAFDFHKRIAELNTDLENRVQEVEELRGALRTKEEQTKQAVQNLETQHEERLKEVTMRLEREKEDRLEQMKTSLIGDKQVVFNEALNKTVSAKDKVIEELKKQMRGLQEELDFVKAERLKEEEGVSGSSCGRLESSEQQEQAVASVPPTYAEETGRPSQQVLWSSQMGQSMMSQSVIPISESASLQERIQQLELELKSKDQEIMRLKSKLEDKMGELSISQDTQNLVKDKISITSCSKGDIVLLCLDEKYDHYVVFTVGATLHFLHSDCLDTLSLRPAPGESRKLWVLAEIVEKEYCQAKKAQNRFKVPMGTKFYRVRCQPWSHPSLTASTMQQPQRSQPMEPQPPSPPVPHSDQSQAAVHLPEEERDTNSGAYGVAEL